MPTANREEFNARHNATDLLDYDDEKPEDRTADPRAIIEAYLDPNCSPHSTYRDITTFRSPERLLFTAVWREELPDPAQNQAQIRAMAFAKDLAEPHHEVVQQALQHSSNHRIEEQSNLSEHDQARLNCFTEYHRQNLAEHPDEWRGDLSNAANYVSDVLQVGEHLAYLGIHQQDDDLVHAGQQMMLAASTTLEHIIDNPESVADFRTAIPAETFPLTSGPDSADHQAESRQHYVELLNLSASEIIDDPAILSHAHQAIAAMVTKRDADAYHAAVLENYNDRVPVPHQHLDKLVTSLNDASFREDAAGFIEEAQNDLLGAPEQFPNTYARIHEHYNTVMTIHYAVSDPQCALAQQAQEHGEQALADFKQQLSQCPDNAAAAQLVHRMIESTPDYDGNDPAGYLIRDNAIADLQFALTCIVEDPSTEWPHPPDNHFTDIILYNPIARAQATLRFASDEALSQIRQSHSRDSL